MRVAFQGELGAFSQQAILQLLGSKARPVPHERFDQVFAALKKGSVDAAAIPIENTLHGSIYANYDLLLNHNFAITAETNVRIVHNLIAPPGMTFARVRQVYSHEVAINQCLDFFARHKRIERKVYYDTAGSVKMIMEEKLDDAAAIASDLAAEIYGARILRRSIEDDRRNFTRFFLLRRKDGEHAPEPVLTQGGEYKTSLLFAVRNVPGALFRALSVFALRDLSLAKIESRPLRGKPWEYLFYVDVIARADDPVLRKALGNLEEIAELVRVLGSYPRAL
jgi:prephenate dehydratase